MVVFAIIVGIGKDSVKMNELICLLHCRRELWRIIAWATSNNTAGKQIAVSVPDDGHFGPAISQKTFIAASFNITFSAMIGRVNEAAYYSALDVRPCWNSSSVTKNCES